MKNIATLSLLLAAALSAPLAEAKQCIWNKGAFVLSVEWVRAADLRYQATQIPLVQRAEAQPVQVDVFPTAQGRCVQSNEPLTAVISIVGNVHSAAYHAPNARFAQMVVPCGSPKCRVKYRGPPSKASGLVDPAEMVWLLATPPTDKYLDVWGTTGDANYGLGGPITR